MDANSLNFIMAVLKGAKCLCALSEKKWSKGFYFHFLLFPTRNWFLVLLFLFHRKKNVRIFKTGNYRPQTMFANVMFLQVSVCPQGGRHVWHGGHAWQWGMHGSRACVVGGVHGGGMCGRGAGGMHGRGCA